MYQPDDAIDLLARCLVAGGVFLSALPLDGSADNTYARNYRCFGARPEELRRVDMGYLDPGHPWKTTIADVYHTLGRAGLVDIKLFRRSDHNRVDITISEAEIGRYRAWGRCLNLLTFGPFRSLVHALFHDHPPRLLLKILFGLERRTWFGSNPFKNAQSPEILVTAIKPG